ncbi:MAG TPA: alpha/beta hydrolase [Solirubrobacteraceae bacterium]|jgi:pimeloyl-ACP methyl ester carboxylesterase|nr:alpha/beta hydrolase [Solirubrobacteraceae bacterium]
MMITPKRRAAAAAMTAILLTIPAGAHAAVHREGRHGHRHPHRTAHRKPTPPSPSAVATIRELPVTFSVVNRNTSRVPCATDGKPYTIAGTLILPAGATPSGVTLYVHGLGFGAYFWHFTAVPGYDFVGYEAEHGHASVIIDRLGYGASGKPRGAGSCIGGQASVLHQVIQSLRHGDYDVSGVPAPSFSRVGLVGHSVGGELVEVEAYSFRDIDALGVMDFVDGDYSPLAYETFAVDGANCALGGQDQGPGGPGGYSPFGATLADFDAVMFHDADPAVVASANATRSLDPCGDILSILTAAGVDLLNIGTINVPIAFVWGQDDALFPDALPWAQTQETLYGQSPKVTNIELPDTGHAVTLERSAPQLQQAMNAWLDANGL